MLRLAGRLLIVTGTLALLAGVALSALFEQWRQSRSEALNEGSRLVRTARGIVEVAETGDLSGPPVVVLHGAPGGFDQSLALGAFLAGNGFRVIALSRPGYLRTPLSSGLLPEDQAEMLVALIDTLQIPEAALLAFAEGAPSAVFAAINHPDRFPKLALLSPLVLPPKSAPSGEFRIPGEAVLEAVTGDLASWWLFVRLRHNPEEVLTNFLRMTCSIIPYECHKLALEILAHPEQAGWFREFADSVTPLGPRESGLRNDIVQTRGLPPIQFQNLNVPVLVARGRLDKIIPDADAEAILKGAPKAGALTAKRAGLLLTGIGPDAEEAEARVVRFLRGLPEPIPPPEPESEIPPP